MAGLAQALKNGIVAREKFLGRDRVKGLADVIVRRDLLEAKQAQTS